MKTTDVRSITTDQKLSSLVMPLVLSIIVALTLLASPAALAQTYSVIHNFNSTEVGVPYAGVTLKDGALYGTTSGNYVNSAGGVYLMTNQGNNWTETPIYFFSGKDGFAPQARVVFGPDSHLYGTTSYGGANDHGTVFRLIPNPSPCKVARCFPWTEDALYSFGGGGSKGVTPYYGDLIWDQAGNIYGTTLNGGAASSGTVYELTPSGNSWTETSLYSFDINSGSDGRAPWAGVIFDSNGNLFGTTFHGGANGWGTVFELKYVVGVGWQETILYNFQNTTDGEGPIAGLVSDSAGNLYGATSQGGSSTGGGGTIFELSPSGNSWAFTTIYTFNRGDFYSCGPVASLTMDNAGNLYGATTCNGAFAMGNVFKLTKSGNGWAYASLHDFMGGSDGSAPFSNVTIDTDGTLYGTASQGGSNNRGLVWQIKP